MTEGISLQQYTQRITKALAEDPLIHGVWVMAELSDVNRHPSGHCYMELIQKDEVSGRTLAKMRATIWKWKMVELDRKFYVATSRRFDSGMKVLLRLEANHSDLYGLSANIIDIDPTFTLGDMERLRREILAKLRAEGVIDFNKRLSIPLNPQRIAVISAAGAAGYGDFVNQIESTSEGFVFYPRLFPAVLQGDSTSPSVRNALMAIESTIDLWDCVVIIRGGGATTDLNGFDDLELARAVAACAIPVIVGIGHERDRTVLDEIACVRCKTPTAVAEYLIGCMRYAEKLATDLGAQIFETVRNRLALQQERLASAAGVIPEIARRRVEAEKLRLMNAGGSISLAANAKTSSALQRLKLFPDAVIRAAEDSILRQQTRLKHLDEMTNVLSPTNTLRRGYSITRVNGHAIRDEKEVGPDDRLTTTLFHGRIISRLLNPNS